MAETLTEFLQNPENCIDATDWRSRVRCVLRSLACQLRRVKCGDEHGWQMKGWLDWQIRKVYVTWTRLTPITSKNEMTIPIPTNTLTPAWLLTLWLAGCSALLIAGVLIGEILSARYL